MKTPELIQAALLLRAGDVVAFPTETVYGLGADAKNAEAIRKVFLLKNRPYDHPLIVHLGSSEQIQDWAMDISPQAEALARAFWPGPLTMVFKKQSHVLDIVTGGQETVGLRVPNHALAQALLHQFGGGIVAPSANQFTHLSPTTAEAVREEFGDRVKLILDGGACSVGLESTIVDMTKATPTILRPGMISALQIENVLNQPVSTTHQAGYGMRVPGMHHLHYAPLTKTVLLTSKMLPTFLKTLSSENLPLVVLVHSDVVLPENKAIYVIKMASDATKYAHDLYHTLRRLDHANFKQIVIEAVPEDTAWDAIRDRLFKATAER